MTNIYVGRVGNDNPQAYVGNDMNMISKLDPGYKHGVNHSPDGFAWGYHGSGPAQLAFAILLHEFGPTLAKAHYQDFKAAVISSIPMDRNFRLTFKPFIGGGLRQGAIQRLSRAHVELEVL